MINKTGDTEVIVAYDSLVRIEHLTYLNSYLCFLEGTGKILYACNGSTDTYVYLCEELARKRIRDGTCEFFEVLVVYACLDFLNKNDFGFCDIEHEVLVLIGEQVLYYVISRNLICGNDAYKEYNTAYIRIEVKLSCLERYIAGKNVIKDNILHEVVSVIFLVIVLLDA